MIDWVSVKCRSDGRSHGVFPHWSGGGQCVFVKPTAKTTSNQDRPAAHAAAGRNWASAFSGMFNCHVDIREPDRCRDLNAIRRVQPACRQLHGSKRDASRERGTDGASLGSERILSVLQYPAAAPGDSEHPEDPIELRQAPRACFLPTMSQRSQSAPQRAA